MNEVLLARWLVVVTLDPQYEMGASKSYLVAPDMVPTRLADHIQCATLFLSAADAHDAIKACQRSDYFDSPVYRFSAAGVALRIAECGGMCLVEKETP